MTQGGRLRPLAAHAARLLGVYAACLGVASLLSWPMLRHLRGHLPGDWPHPDINTAVWFRWHLWQRLQSLESPMFAPELYYPDGMDVTLQIWNLGVALLQSPLVAVLGPLPGYNASLLFLAAFNGLAGYLLGLVVGRGRRGPAILAAAILLSSNFAWVEMIQGRAEQGFLAFAALYVAGLVILRRRGGRGMAVATGLALAAAGLCYWFYAAFLALPLFGLALASGARPRPDRRALEALAIVLGVAVLAMLPAAIPILTRMAAPDSVYAAAVAQTTNVTALVDGLRARYCATLIQTFVWPLAPFPQRVGAGLPFAVIAILGSTLAWRAARQPAGFLPWIALFGLLMAMGPQLLLRIQQPVTVLGTAVPLPSVLMDQLPLFERLWWPYRWIALTAVGAAGCGAALVAAIPAGRRADLLAVVLALAVLIEVRAMFVYAPYTAIAGDPQPLDVPSFLVALGEEPGEHPLLQLPLRRVDDAAVIYMSYHRQPVDGGPGYEDNMLIEPSYLRRTSENEALYALGRMAWGQEVPDVEDPRGELRALGFRYAVFWRGYVPADGRGHMPYSEFFDAEPVYEDEQILAWDLAPVAGTTGAGGP